jgi:hypothetical protein
LLLILAPIVLLQSPGSKNDVVVASSDFGFPAFGPHLTRKIVLVPDGTSARGTN